MVYAGSCERRTKRSRSAGKRRRQNDLGTDRGSAEAGAGVEAKAGAATAGGVRTITEGYYAEPPSHRQRLRG